jgi:ferredoxin
MKIYLIYFSPGGTTKTTVRNIAQSIDDKKKDSQIIELDMQIKYNREKSYTFRSDDLVILGMMTGTTLFGFPQEIFDSIQGNNTPLVAVVMYGNGYYGKSLITMKHQVEMKGFRVVAAGSFIGQASYSNKIASGRPDAKDQVIQYKFGKKIYHKLYVDKDFSFNSKLKMNWSKDDFVTRIKCGVLTYKPGYLTVPKMIKGLSFDTSKCVDCGLCEKRCPVEAINLQFKSFDYDKCIGCASCVNNCPKQAIRITNDKLNNIMKGLEKYRSDRKEPELFF